MVDHEAEGHDCRKQQRREDAIPGGGQGRVPKHREPGEHSERRDEAEVHGCAERELHERDERRQREQQKDGRLPCPAAMVGVSSECGNAEQDPDRKERDRRVPRRQVAAQRRRRHE